MRRDPALVCRAVIPRDSPLKMPRFLLTLPDSMRKFVLLLLLTLALLPGGNLLRAQSDDPSEMFLNAYMSVQQAEKLERDGKLKLSLQKYRFAGSLLDQVADKHPTWQPLIVDYRKKKTAEAIQKVQQRMDAESRPVSTRDTNLEEPLPTKSRGEDPSNEADLGAPSMQRKARELEEELREAKSQLRTVQREKEKIADQLDQALRDADKTKVDAAEVRSKLRQTEDALKNAGSDGGGSSSAEVAKLRDALKTAQAERDAAEEAREDAVRKAKSNENDLRGKLEKAQEAMQAASPDIAKDAIRQQLVAEVADLKKSLRDAQQGKDSVQKTAEEEAKRAKADEAALRQQLVKAQEQFQSSAQDATQTAALSQELAALKKQVEDAQAARDAATKQVEVAKQSAKDRETELQSRLTQAEQTAGEMKNQRLRDDMQRKAAQGDVAKLQRALTQAQAERDAAEEINEDATRRAAKARTAAAALVAERDAANQKLKDAEVRFADADKITRQLAEAQARIVVLEQQGASGSEQAAQITKQLDDAKKELAALAKERDEAKKSGDEVGTRLAAANQQVLVLSQERDSLVKERDNALTQLAQAKEAQKQVDKLLVDNATLMAKLSETEKTITSFNASAPEKDQQIIKLRDELGRVQNQLAAVQQQNDGFQMTIADLQGKLESATSDLVTAQASGEAANSEEQQRLVQENELLRGIVVREMQGQARREQARKLVVGELGKLQVQSTTLLEQVNYLSEPVIKLSERDRALFKQPELELIDIAEKQAQEERVAADAAAAAAATAATPATKGVDGASMDIFIAAPKPDASSGATNEVQTPDTTGTASADELPVKDVAAEGPQVETNIVPKIPEELLPIANEAKEAYERGQFREAEKAYERILAKAPNNVYALSNIGVVRLRSGKLKLAEESFKKAIAIAPEDSFSFRTLGIVLFQQGKFDDGVNVLTKALAINPKDAVAHNYLGITASSKGWQEAAQKELETAVALDPNYADAHFNLAVVFATLETPNRELARKHYQRAVSLGAEADPALEKMLK